MYACGLLVLEFALRLCVEARLHRLSTPHGWWLVALVQVATHNETMRIADCYQDPRWQGHEMDKKNSADSPPVVAVAFV